MANVLFILFNVSVCWFNRFWKNFNFENKAENRSITRHWRKWSLLPWRSDDAKLSPNAPKIENNNFIKPFFIIFIFLLTKKRMPIRNNHYLISIGVSERKIHSPIDKRTNFSRWNFRKYLFNQHSKWPVLGSYWPSSQNQSLWKIAYRSYRRNCPCPSMQFSSGDGGGNW